jgi:hypothetical protein
VLLGWLRRSRHAARRADALVRRVLSDAEQAELHKQGFLELASQTVPGRKYRIPAGDAPVASLEPDGRVVYLCLQPVRPIPRKELVLVHKLLLEADEAGYWQRANRVGRAMGRGFGRRLLS